MRSWLRQLSKSPGLQTAVGVTVAEYLRLVWKSNRLRLDPPNVYDIIGSEQPVIVAMWHGQHYLMPFVRNEDYRAKALISRHRDGAINAAAAEWLGVRTIRGSGTHTTDFNKKGGVTAFREMLDALEAGYNVALTADVPKVARVCGLGIVKLAGLSGRPIYPVAIATSRRRELSNWDRSAVPLPFGRAAAVAGTPIRVPRDANDAALQAARQAVEASLNAVTARAYHIADNNEGGERDRG